MVERRRIFPAFAERLAQLCHGWTTNFELYVVPRRPRAVTMVEYDRLGVPAVVTVVVSTVAEVHAADERDVVVRAGATPNHDELLVVAAASPHPFVERDDATRLVHAPREKGIVLLAEMECPRVRPPDQRPHVDAPTCERLE